MLQQNNHKNQRNLINLWSFFGFYTLKYKVLFYKSIQTTKTKWKHQKKLPKIHRYQHFLSEMRL